MSHFADAHLDINGAPTEMKRTATIEVRRGEVVRYHPTVGLPDYIRVRIVTEPYELADGTLICKARRLDNGKPVWPGVHALSLDDGT